MKKYPKKPNLLKKARLLEIVGEPTRIRILCMMLENSEACVTDIAESLGMSIASTSHHLQIMRDNGLFTTERRGNSIYYRIVKNDFTRIIKKLIC
ncbi:ArsR/SmtB family transcription factor [Patescibacteria group bacterium]